MKNALGCLISYVMDGQADPALRPAIGAVTPDYSMVIGVAILGWLRLEDDPRKQKPLSLYPGSKWQRLVGPFVMSVPALNELFEVGPLCLDFRETVSREDRRLARKFVQENYVPPRFR